MGTIIAIDGYSSTGKSSLAKAIAKELDFIHVDTGAMYRAITLYGLNHFYEGGNGEINEAQLIEDLPNIQVEFQKTPEGRHLFLNGEDVESEIRNIEVSSYVSKIASNPEVRAFLVQKQQEMAQSQNIVMDGRDIGTVVFPNADLKFFITADLEVRAQRRYEDLSKIDPEVDFEEVRDNLKARDEADVNREHSPLKQAEDAILIDNTYQSKEETINEMMDIIHQKLKW